MDEVFRKLDKHEAKGRYHSSEWDKFEATLPKKKRKKGGWLWFFMLINMLWVVTIANWVHVPDLNKYENASLDFVSSNNPIIEKTNIIQRNTMTSHLELNDPVINENDTNTRSNVNVNNGVNSHSNIVLSQVGNLINQLNSTKRNSTISKHDLLTSKRIDISNKVVSKKNIIQLMQFSETPFLTVSLFMPNPKYIEGINCIEKRPHSTTIFGGIRASLINKLASNESSNRISYGTGIYLQINRSTARLVGLNFQLGIQSEYNQELNYSYVSDRTVFLNKSEKRVNIAVKQLFLANFQLSAALNWNHHHITNIGGYYSHVLQSLSNISTTGTGVFSNINELNKRQSNYHNLLNANDIGIYLAQTYRIKSTWAIALEVFMGTNNRLNASYFGNTDVKHKEVSLSILKKL